MNPSQPHRVPWIVVCAALATTACAADGTGDGTDDAATLPPGTDVATTAPDTSSADDGGAVPDDSVAAPTDGEAEFSTEGGATGPAPSDDAAPATLDEASGSPADPTSWVDGGASTGVGVSEGMDNDAAVAPVPQHPATPVTPTPGVPGGVLLDGYGGLHPFGGFRLDTTNAPYWNHWDIARALVVIPDGSGGWVLDGWGGIHAFGHAPAVTGNPYWHGQDLARSFVVLADHRSGYVLDATGALHPFGPSAPTLTGPSVPGSARGLEVHLTREGAVDGAWVLDAFGVIHPVGAAPPQLGLPTYGTYDIWQDIHSAGGNFYVVGRWGILQPLGFPPGIPLTGLPDWGRWDIVRDVVPVNARADLPFDTSRNLRCPGMGAYCGFESGMRGRPDVLHRCPAAGTSPLAVTACPYGCHDGACLPPPPPPPPPAPPGGGLRCSARQWWNAGITYTHVVGGWNDTDLGLSGSTPVQLRHASRLDRTGVYAWGYMPEFTDMASGQRYRLLHLRPQAQNATAVGTVYPAGFIVGQSGGDTRDTGLGIYSTGAHLCVQTLAAFRAVFPSGTDSCM